MRASGIFAHISTSETGAAERMEGINKSIISCFTSTLTQRGEHNFAGTTGKKSRRVNGRCQKYEMVTMMMLQCMRMQVFTKREKRGEGWQYENSF